MTRTELHQELLGLADSLDEHVTAGDAATVLRVLSDGLFGTDFDEDE